MKNRASSVASFSLVAATLALAVSGPASADPRSFGLSAQTFTVRVTVCPALDRREATAPETSETCARVRETRDGGALEPAHAPDVPAASRASAPQPKRAERATVAQS